MLTEVGKRLPTLVEYAALLLPMEHSNDRSCVNHVGAFTEPEHDRIVPVETSPGRFRFTSGPEFSPRIYRGQTQFHDVCKPSLYRREAVEAMFWVTKTIELGEVLWQHPGVSDLLQLILEDHKFDFNLEAIAQHYGYPTVFLDFSRSKDVAMFFATCVWDKEARRYSPLSSGRAVLYTADLRALIFDPNRKGVLPLGFEPLPRPEVQLAMSVWLDLHENLNDMPWARWEEIELTTKLSGQYFEMFEEGKTLFPVDSFDSCIDALRQERFVSSSALKLALQMGALPRHPHGIDGVMREFEAKNYDVRHCTHGIPAHVSNKLDADWSRRRREYFGRIAFRGVAEHFGGS
jgi:hypothetical protein